MSARDEQPAPQFNEERFRHGLDDLMQRYPDRARLGRFVRAGAQPHTRPVDDNGDVPFFMAFTDAHPEYAVMREEASGTPAERGQGDDLYDVIELGRISHAWLLGDGPDDDPEDHVVGTD